MSGANDPYDPKEVAALSPQTLQAAIDNTSKAVSLVQTSEAAINQIQPKKTPSGYLHATVGIYPGKRLIRRHSLELKRVKFDSNLANNCLSALLAPRPRGGTLH